MVKLARRDNGNEEKPLVVVARPATKKKIDVKDRIAGRICTVK